MLEDIAYVGCGTIAPYSGGGTMEPGCRKLARFVDWLRQPFLCCPGRRGYPHSWPKQCCYSVMGLACFPPTAAVRAMLGAARIFCFQHTARLAEWEHKLADHPGWLRRDLNEEQGVHIEGIQPDNDERCATVGENVLVCCLWPVRETVRGCSVAATCGLTVCCCDTAEFWNVGPMELDMFLGDVCGMTLLSRHPLGRRERTPSPLECCCCAYDAAAGGLLQ